MNYTGTKVPGTFNARVFGDCHLGNRRTNSIEVLDGLYSICKEDAEFATLDMIIIEGDLFDSGLPLYHEHVPLIQRWMVWLLGMCEKHDVMLRVLEGTPSHDMGQSIQFDVLRERFNANVDFKYVNKLYIEEHPKGFSILYVPDEWTTSHERTYMEAKELLVKHNLTKVTLAVMHGAFEHQLPNIDVAKHNNAMWEALVQHCIFVGHIHQYSKVGIIIAAGSTDRYTHGDEKPKGHIVACLSDQGCKFKFVENKLAKKYVTIDCRNLTVEESLAKIEAAVKPLPAKSHVRFRYTKHDNMDTAREYLHLTYPTMFWTGQVMDAEDSEVTKNIELVPKNAFEAVSITKENIMEMVFNKLSCSGQHAALDAAMQLLGEICED